MRARRSVAATGLVALLLAAGAVTGLAKSTQNYRFKFSQKMRVSWEWPVNPFNMNRRDTGAFDVLKGSGCGTTPAHARWSIVEQTEGTPAYSLIVDLIFGTRRNPALLVDSFYGGTPAANVKIFMSFPKTKSKVKVTAKAVGDVVSLTITPSSAGLSATKVGHC
jgi:hypothetical protein